MTDEQNSPAADSQARHLAENTPAPAGPGPAPDSRIIRVTSPSSALAVVPSLLGFVPSLSLVVIGARPPRGRVRVAFRYDLPDPPDAALAASIAMHAADVLGRQELPVAVVIGYGPGSLVTPVADAIREEFSRCGVELKEMLRAEDSRYWSYLCGNPQCCPAEGVPFAAPILPAMAAGGTVLKNRAALVRTLAPLGGAVAKSMQQATRRAEQRARDLTAGVPQPGQHGDLSPFTSAGLRAVSEAIDAYQRGDAITSDDQIAWLSVVLSIMRIRDDAWARMDPRHRTAHLRLWTDIVRRACPQYMPAPAALLAFTAWQSGDGALANVALDRALEADPGYSMAHLLLEAISAGMPPTSARLPMTPEEVAASYEHPPLTRT